ncbi:MAG: NAD(P)/FAD-dependent oxidoreductase [Curvibacter sp.]|nr:NAD(P)/FAD-dependent oxidoreductase [Curvibacter sp.]
MDYSKNVVVVGAGPAGLTAALELQKAGYHNVTVIEADEQVGGISRTVNYKGNRIDIGGHRFFSKSDWVMNWWTSVLPIEDQANGSDLVLKYKGMQRGALPKSSDSRPESSGGDMLVRNRLSRIYYNAKFFDYPLKLNASSLRKLGFNKVVLFGFSYMMAKLHPIKPEKSLEDFFINRFGRRLFLQFFKEYTEKVWGVACRDISADWGAQRIKSLSVLKAIKHALRSLWKPAESGATETSLIEHFLYPRLGPGQMWETVAQKFLEAGGQIWMNTRAQRFEFLGERISLVEIKDSDGEVRKLACDYLISTMPIKDLVRALPPQWEPDVRAIATNLEYRDFITIGLLYLEKDIPKTLRDNWIYIQEPGVQVGRVQVFNNWSPNMVAKSGTIWLGLEYFCKETDDLWKRTDKELTSLAQEEMFKIGLTGVPAAEDAVVIRVPKAYPGYFGEAYHQFDRLRAALDKIENLFLIGRNGMHRYNNQDHSMLTAKKAVELIVSGRSDKEEIWAINIDDEYHEEQGSK